MPPFWIIVLILGSAIGHRASAISHPPLNAPPPSPAASTRNVVATLEQWAPIDADLLMADG